MTQAQQLLDYMRRHGAVTVKQARDALGISNVVGRIWDIERGRGCPLQIVQRDQVEVLNRDGEVCRVNRYWLAGTPTPPPGAPVEPRRRRRADEAARLRRVVERRRQRLVEAQRLAAEAEARAADAEALSAQLSDELEALVEDRRRSKATEIRAGLRAARGRTQADLFAGGA